MRSKRSVLVSFCLLATLLAAPISISTPAPPAEAASDACGTKLVRPATSGGGYWTCTMAEHFLGSRLDPNRWTALNQTGEADLCVVNSPRTVSVGSGKLRLSAVRTGLAVQCPRRPDGTRGKYAGATVSSFWRWSQQYGRMEARIKVRSATQPGLHEAFWMWPDVRYGSDRPWPASGEIDIMETYSARPTLSVPFLHYSADSLGAIDGFNTSWSCRSQRGQWHTYVLEWTATRLAIIVDGKTCLVNTHGAAAFRKRFIINFSQLLGGGNNLYTGRVALPATMEVDWVKAWR
ncbi:hypothetical protein ASE01_07930 [Nocardioides sp. Root190]|uniref:glycoside hydrolase family 16 protein n=1 Tax=Nocardioides sp. Root190 TaxID=1736488 RepID=UPI0006FE8BCF|nr:glycoside hydrolase family 16 protein [Nocardioides sp. Root190]KRB78081.1 hypothetical protein ASE01_07930 [Nocardioides sp. Root190]